MIDAKTLKDFTGRTEPRVLVVGKKRSPDMQMRKVAHTFRSLLEVAYIHKSDWGDYGKEKIGKVSEVSAVLFTGSGLPDALAAVVKGQERESVAGLLEHGVVPAPSRSLA